LAKDFYFKCSFELPIVTAYNIDNNNTSFLSIKSSY